MMQTMKARKKHLSDNAEVGITRITVSMPAPNYEHLLRVSEGKRVSVSWVVRDTVEKYLDADVPLLARIEK